jgi:isopentenyldiphosphate isomerase
MPEEMLVICDENNNIVGECQKSVVHRYGLWHRGVHLWITDGSGNVLQQYRDPCKKILPAVWDIAVVGHVSAGESPVATVIKKAREKLGLMLTEQDVQPACATIEDSITRTDMLIETTPTNGWKHRVFAYNFVTCCPELNLKELAFKHDDVRWYPIDELEADLKILATARKHAYRPNDNHKLYKISIHAMRRLSIS